MVWANNKALIILWSLQHCIAISMQTKSSPRWRLQSGARMRGVMEHGKFVGSRG